jgi:hypothetical protein
MQTGAEFSYEERYGKSGGNRWVPYAFGFAMVGLLWVFWAGLHHSNPAISSQLITFEVTGEKEISLRYSIARSDPNQVVICTLAAKDQDKNVVGQIDDRIDAGKTQSEQTTIIPARSTPFSASIVRCRAE